LIDNTRELGIQRVFTFAAMATSMRPEDNSRVFAAATDGEILRDLQPFDLELADEGYIGGLNGVLMGVAAESGLHGACLLGEIPRIFAQLPSPKGALAVLRAFSSLAEIDIDLRELSDQAATMDQQLSELLEQVEHALEEQEVSETEFEEFRPGSLDEDILDPEDKQHIEQLFAATQQDRSKAFELKAELDRLNVFRDYEDRFLDLFKKPQ
jgi:predicted ATP-grasp superfamily ATP-dependent carboligase